MEQIAQYLVGMPPASAVDIMMNMEDQDLIDILRTVERLAQEAGEQSIVSYWFSLMAERNPERAAALQRKWVKKPEPNIGG
jgi:flagellar protein FlbB